MAKLQGPFTPVFVEWRAERDRKERNSDTLGTRRTNGRPTATDETPLHRTNISIDDLLTVPISIYERVAEEGEHIPSTRDAETSRKVRELAVALQPLGQVKPILKSRYLIKGWLDRSSLAVVYGASNVGKSFFALDMALHVAGGTHWHDAPLTTGIEYHPVLYLAAEGGTGMRNRIEAFRMAHPEIVTKAEKLGTFLLLSSYPIDLYSPGDAEALLEALPETHRQLSLIVVDTLARTMGDGDENSSRDITAYLRNIELLRRQTGATVMVIHHSGKDASRGARGSSGLRAAIDTEIEIRSDGPIIRAETRKQRDLPIGKTFDYALRSVIIGHDEDGDAVTSAVVEKINRAQVAHNLRLSSQERIAMKALSEALSEQEKSLTQGPLACHTLLPISMWQEHCKRLLLTEGLSDGAIRTAFSRVKKSLKSKELVDFDQDKVWLVTS